jgi:hypothetical protein
LVAHGRIAPFQGWLWHLEGKSGCRTLLMARSLGVALDILGVAVDLLEGLIVKFGTDTRRNG